MKKLTSIITAAAMLACSVPALTTNAAEIEYDPIRSVFELGASTVAEKYPGYELLYSRDAYVYYIGDEEIYVPPHELYINEDAVKTERFLRVDYRCVNIMSIYASAENEEAVLDLLHSYCEGFYSSTTLYTEKGESYYKYYYVDLAEYPEVRAIAKDIVADVEKIADVKEAYIKNDYATALFGLVHGNDPTYFMEITKEQAEGIDAYMQATGYNYTTTLKEIPLDLERNIDLNINFEEGEITEEEEFQLALDIANEFQIELPIEYLLSNNELTPQTEVDILNSVEGDANNDGAVGISDVTYIMQSISDTDNYSLSAQQTFNADVTGGNDGITAEDALVIQKYLAGQTDTLG